ncbi:MAG: hypothetical protein AAB691_00885 [Patescibacteria group bacterium]
MTIEWNKVTWYSKLIALVLFVALPLAGFYLGMMYQEMRDVGHEGRRIVNQLKTDTSTSFDVAQDKSLSINNSQLIIDTANWKTYRSDKYGFEFMYPAEWKFSENLNEGSILLWNYEDKDVKRDPPFEDLPGANIEIKITTANEKCLGSLDFACYEGDSLALFAPDQSEQLVTSTIQVDGIKSLRVDALESYFTVYRYPAIYIGVPYKNYLYRISIMDGGNKKNFPLFDQILSTFKFTK